jgi:putative hemolysin
LLAELRDHRTQIAIVVDEGGGTAGRVTPADVREEPVGTIADEFDPSSEPARGVAPGTLEVDGRLAVGDLLDRLDLDRAAIGPVAAESVGGLVVDRPGRLPRPGDAVRLGPLRPEDRSTVDRRVGIAPVARAAVNGAGR